MQGWFNICKALNAMQHINRSKDKKHLIISTGTEKTSVKSNIISDKSSMKTRNRGMYLNILKAMYDNIEQKD
jgi:metal-dependent amidase/aminoacylase/carboxypeptidase family protein